MTCSGVISQIDVAKKGARGFSITVEDFSLGVLAIQLRKKEKEKEKMR